MRWKAVLFDLDGTLVYTADEFRYVIVERVCTELGTALPERRHIDAFWFLGNRDVIIQEFFHLDPAVFWDCYIRHDSLDLHKEHAGAYVDSDIVAQLKAEGYKIGVVTSSMPLPAEQKLGLIGRELFDVVISANKFNNIDVKPSPQGINICLEKLGVKPEDAVYVGNGDEDVAAAQNAGVVDIFLDRGEHDYSHVTPTHTITSLHDLKRILGQ